MHDGASAVADYPVAQVGVADAAELIAAEHALMIENPKSYRQYEGAIGVSSRRPGKCGRKMTTARANAITLFTGALPLDDGARIARMPEIACVPECASDPARGEDFTCSCVMPYASQRTPTIRGSNPCQEDLASVPTLPEA